jgi:hypothetical protein
MRARAFAVLFGGAASLVACTTEAPPVLKDELTTTEPGHFRYVATATMLHPLNGSEGEHHRLERLKRRLADARLCPDGFRIVTRVPPIAFGKTQEGDYVVRDVTYVGECTG